MRIHQGRLLMPDSRPKVVYFGCDGTVWHLAGPGQGSEGVWLGPSPSRPGAPISHLTLEGSRSDGAYWQGSTLGTATLGFTAFVLTAPGWEFEDTEVRWRRAWSDKQPGHWCEWTPRWGWWCLKVRKHDAPRELAAQEASMRGAAVWEHTALAEDPLWRTWESTDAWSTPTVLSDFVPGYVSAWNRGLRAAKPLWLFTGPGTWRVRDSGRYVVLPELLPGEELLVDTRDEQWTAYSSLHPTVNRWAQIRGRLTESLAPGERRLLEVGIKDGTTASRAEVIVPARWEEAP